jgi:hypothetical protein
VDDGTGANDVAGVVPVEDLGPQGRDVGRPSRLGVAPGDRHTPATRDEGKGAHPGPADADEMHRPRVRGVE